MGKTDFRRDLKRYGPNVLALLPLPIAVLRLESLYWLVYLGAFAALVFWSRDVLSSILNYRQTYRSYQRVKAETGSALNALQVMSGIVPVKVGWLFFGILMPIGIIEGDMSGALLVGGLGFVLMSAGAVLMAGGYRDSSGKDRNMSQQQQLRNNRRT